MLVFLIQVVCAFQSFLAHPRILRIPLRKIRTLDNSLNLIQQVTRIGLKPYNSQYVGTVALGTPAQDLEVIFDTGSANFWINSKMCQELGCQSHKAYDHQSSSSFEKFGTEIEVQFGSGSVMGRLNYEKVKIGNIEIAQQGFGEIFEESGQVFIEGRFSGILGLAFPQMATSGVVPVFDSMIAEHLLDQSVFSFYFSESEGSELILGGIDYTKFSGKILWTQVIQEFYWTILVTDVKIGAESLNICHEGCKAAIDTGTTYLTAPSDLYDVLLSRISCDDLQDIVFTISGHDFAIPPSAYLQSIKDCSLNIAPLEVPEP